MKKIMIWSVFVLLNSASVFCIDFGPQPRIVSSNGHVIFKAALHKNISFHTSGEGRVHVNGVDLTEAAHMAKNASRFVGRYQANFQDTFEKLTRLERLIQGHEGVLHRLSLIENDSRNMSGSISPTVPARNIPRLNRRINSLERRLTALMSIISKDECTSNPCKNGASCQDLFDTFMCVCPPEWEGPLCDKDVNECARFAGTDLGCQNGATCVNKPGTYECLCGQGWLGIHCTRRSSDCNAGSNFELCAHGTCISTNDRVGYKCLCDQGWKTDGTNAACNVDVDECKMDRPPCSVNPPVTCINLPGSFYCGHCPEGYAGNGYYCSDKNECEKDNGGCSSLVQCINTPGSRICGPCPPGYVGNGITCSYQGICSVNNGGCHPLAQCQHQPRISSTYVECICPSGYTGTGVGQNGCVQLSESLNQCSSNPCINGICSIYNRTGEYVCVCYRKYTGKNCQIKKNPCDPNPCRNGGTCHPLLTISFTCMCSSSYTGLLCGEERQACGGKLRGEEGILKYPAMESTTYGHRISCAWTIETTNLSKVLNITFSRFSLENSRECQYDWLQIHDGRNSASHSLGRFCGNSLPNGGVIISTHNIIYLWFRSDHSVAKTGFELTWTSVNPACGFELTVTSHGTMRSPGSPGNYPPNRDCYWILRANPGKRLLFHFFSLFIGDNNDCKHDYIEFLDENTPNGPPFEKYCNTSHPPPLYSPGNEVVIHFHSSNTTKSYPGFQLTYSLTEAMPGCGGVYTMDNGELKSPVVDGTYPPDVTCEYTIKLAPNSKIRITFISFALEDSTDCQFDFVSIHEGTTADAPSVGKYCGTMMPPPYTSTTNEILIVFKTDWATSDSGFHIKYESVCGGVYSEPTGIIESPGYPGNYLPNKICLYEIVQPMGKSIVLNMINFTVESNSYPDCIYDYLEIRDGDNENSTLVGRYCQEPPPTVLSTYNYLWMKFESDSSVGAGGFQANYSTISVGCGGIMKNKIGTISSPEHPSTYPSETECKWVIVASPGNVIQLTWMNFHVEPSYNCVYDQVSVFDNHTTTGMGGLMGTYCGNALPPTLLSSSNVMTIKFYADTTVNLDGFLATYTFVNERNVCGGNYFTGAGIIKSPHYPSNYPTNSECTWTITVRSGQQIMLNITDFNIEFFSACRYDFLSIHNGGTAASPLIGKYCGTKIPKLIQSHSNKLYLHFKSDMTKTSTGFRIYWDSATTGCGGRLTSPTGLIISPHYPDPYSRNAECFWQISISAGSLIQIIFADIDLEPHLKCILDYIEMFDGPTSSSPLLGKFCRSTHPPYIRSTSNHLSVKFKSDISYQGRGFQLQYSTVCNTKFRGFRGIIESPNFPNGYPHDQQCEWDIEVPLGNKINITFSHFELESSGTSPGNCSYDYVEIKYAKKEEFGDDEDYVPYAKYCGSDVPGLITLDSELAKIIFVSDNFLLGNGFRLEWQVEGCGGLLTHPTGTIKTPNYPSGYPSSTVCTWVIKVEMGYSIQLTFLDVALEREVDCDYDYVQVNDGPEETSPMMTKFCSHLKKPVVITGSGNTMFVKFASDYSYRGRGFIANYTTTNSKCGGKFTAPSGTIRSPNYPQNYDRNDACEWLIEIDDSHTIELNIKDIDLFEGCEDNYIKVYDGPSQTYPLLETLCGKQSPNGTIKSTTNNMFVEFRTRGFITTKGFQAEYFTACGARIVTNGTGLLHFSEKTNLGQDQYNCSWTIISSDPSQHVSLIMTYLSMTLYCEEYNPLKVYNGENNEAPLLGEYCGNKIPPKLVSDGNALHILIEDTSINIYATYSVFDSHCGGTLSSASGFFSSPNYPRGYPVDTQCEWTIQSSPGNSVTLTFTEFDLAESDNCNSDYLEIRKNDSLGILLGVFCGKNMPKEITHIGSLWMLFKSAKGEDTGGIIGKGFFGEYTLVHGNELSGPSGRVASPLYPEDFKSSGEYSWRITVEFGWRMTIKFIDFYLEDYYQNECYTVNLEIYDGYDDTAPLIDSYCGLATPDPIKSSSNILFIKAVYASPSNSKFLLEWLQVENVKSPKAATTKVDGCGFDEVIDMTALKNFTVQSPGYPYGYASRLNCEWIFSTVPQKHLSFKISDINLEHSLGNCQMDKVSVYSGVLGTDQWQLKANFCTTIGDFDRRVHTSNLLKVVFQTDAYVNETGFKGMVFQECGGSMTQPNGVISYDNTTNTRMYYREIDCVWNVTVRPGRTIEVSFEKMRISRGSDDCQSYVMLRNGLFSNSPLLGNGKYCNDNITGTLKTSGNHLYVKYSGSSRIEGFAIKYKEVSVACSYSIVLTNLDNMTEISSPNYPNIPSPHIECTWSIMAPPGEILHIDFKDRFDLTKNDGCTKEAVEIRDGGTKYSPLIGRFCDAMPSSQFTTDNMAFIMFMTDVDDPKNGFKATVSLGTCGGTVRGKIGNILSPYFNSKALYPKNADCTWHVVGPLNHYLKLKFDKIDLDTPRKNCSLVDHVTISEILKINGTVKLEKPIERTIGEFCGDTIPDEIVSSSNEIIIHFQTDNRAKQLVGFNLTFNASTEACGGVVEAENGEIQTPGYPLITPKNRRCIWIIKVPTGRRVTLKVLDQDLGVSDESVHIFHDENYYSIIPRAKGPDRNIIKSSDNTMLVYYWSSFSNSRRGFKAIFSSNEPTTCQGDLNSVEGVLKRPENISTYCCTWIYKKTEPKEETLVFKISARFNYKAKKMVVCNYASTMVQVTTENIKSTLSKICANTTRPRIVRSPFLTTMLTASETEWAGNITFDVSYKKYPCGGIVSKDGVITSPGYPNAQTNGSECSWLIKVPEGQIIKIYFVDLNLGEDCDSSFLSIYNGDLPTSPRIAKYCHNNKPEPIISQMNSVFMEYHADAGSKGAFSIRHERISGGCGGITSDESKAINSPSFPNDYPNNTECIWELHANKGYYISIRFVERFHIEDSDNCNKDSLEIFDWKEDTWQSIKKLCGRETPQSVNSTSTKMRIVFRSNEKVGAAGFKFNWNTNCGGKFVADEKKRYIFSPGYPHKYAKELNCLYEIVSNKSFNVVFEDFEIESGPGVTCRYDNVTIAVKKQMYMPEYKKVHCSTNKPSNIRHSKAINITFQTDKWLEAKGFKLYYTTDDCGGIITEPTMISSPKSSSETLSPYYPLVGPTNCYWNVTAPKNKVVVVRFESFELDHSIYCSYCFVEIFNELNLNKTSRLALLCGNLTQNPPIVKSTNNTMLIHLRTDYTNNKNRINAYVYFMHGPAEGCGGKINVSTTKAVLQAPLLDDLDCHWEITAKDGDRIQIEINELNLPNSSFIEIKDGAGPFAEQIDLIKNNSMTQSYMTSNRNAWIRYYAIRSSQITAFKITLTALPSVCGQLRLTATNETSVLTSPGYPNPYPNDVKCKWFISAASPSTRMILHIVDFDLSKKDAEDHAVTKCEDDRLEIVDTSNSRVISEGLGTDLIFNGGNKLSYRENRLPLGTHQFCGKTAVDFDYYTGYNGVQIAFYSGNLKHGKGFKMEYKLIGCNRNYTSSQGRLVHEHINGHCYMIIAVPPNSTISLYFNSFYMYDQKNCVKAGLEINDGGPPDTNTASGYKFCGSTNPNPIFSTTNRLWLHVWNSFEYNWGNYDITYTSSNAGRGCGGTIYNYNGRFSSPMFPDNYRNNSYCTWEIRVPAGLQCALKFTVFDVQAACATDYVIVTTYENDISSEHRFCENDNPAVLYSNNRITVQYKTSPNNGGTGWLAAFQSATTDTKIMW